MNPACDIDDHERLIFNNATGEEIAEDDLTIHDTPTVQINPRQQVFLSNLPLITAATGEIIAWPEPGLPDAAIFQGYSLNENDIIQPSATRRIQRVERLLVGTRQALRHLVQHNSEEYEDLYLSRFPRHSVGQQVEEEFYRYLDNNS